MATALENTAGVDKVVKAFFAGRSAKAGYTSRGVRYETDGETIWIWRNRVAWWSRPNGVRKLTLSDAGWETYITKQMLNEVLRMAYHEGVTNIYYNIIQRHGDWYIPLGDGFLEWGSPVVVTRTALKFPSGRHLRFIERIRRPSRARRGQREVARQLPTRPYRRPEDTPTLFENRRKGMKRRRHLAIKNLHTAKEIRSAKWGLYTYFWSGVQALMRRDMRDYVWYLGHIGGLIDVAYEEQSEAAEKLYYKAVKAMKYLQGLDSRVKRKRDAGRLRVAQDARAFIKKLLPGVPK